MIEALEDEYVSLNTVLKMSSDDLIFNNTNLTTYIDQKLEAINISMDAFTEGLNNVLANSEKIVQFPSSSDEDVD